MSQPPPVAERPGYLVKRVQQLLRQACDEELRPDGLSLAQYAVLTALAGQPGASSAELARLCFVTRQSLQDMLRGLRAAGLVAVATRAGTGRARPVTLTGRGETALHAADRAVGRVEFRMVDGISVARQRNLRRLLAECAENLG